MQRALVTYVRHAMARADDGVDPTLWELGDEGRRLAGRLAERLEVAPRIGALLTSTEPKAQQTAAVIAERWPVDVVADDRLREVERPWIGTGYRSVAHRYLRGELPDGWEPHPAVAERASAAVAAALEAAGSAPVVVVSHGLVLAVHLGDLFGGTFDREAFWSCLAFPDAWTLDDAGTLHRPLVGLAAP
ncbi:MAG: histidine phosphatase family protein [Acidimicrobiales bacterium]|nr:histidine phosphatase family protein [Acidimicrobiales bacterium]